MDLLPLPLLLLNHKRLTELMRPFARGILANSRRRHPVIE